MKPRLALLLAVLLASAIGACGSPEGDDTGSPGAAGTTGAGGSIGGGAGAGRGGIGGSTAGTPGTSGLQVNGMCYPVCSATAIDPENDGWGWEQAAMVSCIVSGSAIAAMGTPCTPDGGAMGGASGTAGRGGQGGTAGTGTAGAAGTGAGGTAGQSNTAVCNFASGLNIAWVSFARDVPNPNTATFRTIFQNTYNAGGRVIRWWFHTNGTLTPGYDASGMAVQLPQSHIDGVKAILSTAASVGVRIVISLWSFDMLQSNAGNTYMQNRLLLENDTNRQAYIDRYLTPLVTALRGASGLYSYEIFNEPEGMGPRGWATYRTTQAAIQKTVNWLAAAIHTADPGALVTNGSQTFDYCSNGISGKSNWYSDSALRSAGSRQNGTLDFYEVHYYDANESQASGTALSPFAHPASYWGLDKRLVIGEFYAVTTDGAQTNDLYTNLYNGGYNGAWAWQYNDSGNTPAGTPIRWPSMQTAIQNVYNAHMAEVNACR